MHSKPWSTTVLIRSSQRLPSLNLTSLWCMSGRNLAGIVSPFPRTQTCLRGRVHQFFSQMHKFFSYKLTGIFLPTLDHGFIMSRRILKSTLCFIGYTIFYSILFYFLRLYHTMFTGCCLCSGTTILLPLLAKNDVSILLSDVLLPPSASITLEQR